MTVFDSPLTVPNIDYVLDVVEGNRLYKLNMEELLGNKNVDDKTKEWVGVEFRTAKRRINKNIFKAVAATVKLA